MPIVDLEPGGFAHHAGVAAERGGRLQALCALVYALLVGHKAQAHAPLQFRAALHQCLYGGHGRRTARFHVRGAAPPDHSVPLQAAEGLARLPFAVGGHDVQVSIEYDPDIALVPGVGDEVGATRREFIHHGLQPDRLHLLRAESRRLHLISRRIHMGDPHQRLRPRYGFPSASLQQCVHVVHPFFT